MSRHEFPTNMVTTITRSMMFQTFARIYESGFGVPLYVESHRQQNLVRAAGNDSDFCVGLNRGNGCCTRCICAVLPSPQMLMPWTWSAPCRAKMQVTMVPLTGWGKPIAWLISGHYRLGATADNARELPQAVIRKIGADRERRKYLKDAYFETVSIPHSRHELMVRYLETCCELIEADLIHFLEHAGQRAEAAYDGTNGGASASRTETKDGGIAIRSRLEAARRRFLRTGGGDLEIAHAAREYGWKDEDEFKRDFLECYGESPARHWQRISELWRTFSEIISAIENEPAESRLLHPHRNNSKARNRFHRIGTKRP